MFISTAFRQSPSETAPLRAEKAVLTVTVVIDIIIIIITNFLSLGENNFLFYLKAYINYGLRSLFYWKRRKTAFYVITDIVQF